MAYVGKPWPELCRIFCISSTESWPSKAKKSKYALEMKAKTHMLNPKWEQESEIYT